jgi:acetate kinase
VLGGVDAIIFTGGIGENSVQLRQIVCDRLAFLNLKIDAVQNAQPKLDQDIATPDSSVRVLIIRANEEWQIAKQCHRLARKGVSMGR